MATITIQQAQATLLELIHNLPLGDELLITENGVPVAKLARTPQASQQATELKGLWPCKAGSAKGRIRIAPDFDEPLESFQEYME